MKNSHSEYNFQVTVTDYIRWQYPSIIFRSDLGGIKFNIGQAVKIKKIQGTKAFPDLFVLYPVSKFHGLFLELKIRREEIYRQDGIIRKNDHIREQLIMIQKLNQFGYAADFACSFEDAKRIIDLYIQKGQFRCSVSAK